MGVRGLWAARRTTVSRKGSWRVGCGRQRWDCAGRRLGEDGGEDADEEVVRRSKSLMGRGPVRTGAMACQQPAADWRMRGLGAGAASTVRDWASKLPETS